MTLHEKYSYFECENQMKIVHVISSLAITEGGPPVACVQLASEEQQHGAQVSVVHFSSNNADSKLIFIPNKLPVHHIPLTKLAVFRGFIIKNLSLTDHIENADIVHVHGVWEPQLLLVMRYCRRAGIPVVISPHGMLYPFCLAQKKWKKQIFLTLKYRSFLRDASAIRVLNQDERQAIDQLKLGTATIEVPNGVQSLVSHEMEHNNRRGFLFVGRLHWIKGLDILLKVYAQYIASGGSWPLTLVGPDGGIEDELHSLVKKLKIPADKIYFKGLCVGEVKQSLLTDNAIYIQLSRHETFSMSVLEAMLFSMPVVISEESHFPELMGEDFASIVDVNDTTEIAELLCKLEQLKSEEIQVLGQQAHDFVATNYQWGKVSKTMLGKYRMTISSGTNDE